MFLSINEFESHDPCHIPISVYSKAILGTACIDRHGEESIHYEKTKIPMSNTWNTTLISLYVSIHKTHQHSPRASLNSHRGPGIGSSCSLCWIWNNIKGSICGIKSQNLSHCWKPTIYVCRGGIQGVRHPCEPRERPLSHLHLPLARTRAKSIMAA